MSVLQRWVSVILLAFLGAGPAAAQWPGPLAVAADADLIAVHSREVERRLMRVRFDRAAGTVSFAPFGPAGIETFAVAPKGAFIVYAGVDPEGGDKAARLFLLDEAGRPLGTPIPSPVGDIAAMAVSPRGDRVALRNKGGWVAILGVIGTGPARRLVPRATFGAAADGAFDVAFLPDGGLATLTEDWILSYRAADGRVLRTIDLTRTDSSLSRGRWSSEIFRLVMAPRGDRFAVIWGGGPIAASLFDRNGRRLTPRDAAGEPHLGGTGVEFLAGGSKALIFGMLPPALIDMKAQSAKPFLTPDVSIAHAAVLGDGRTIAVIERERVALWADDGKRLVAPTGFENVDFGAAAAGAGDTIIVATERGGWVDLYTKHGKFLRRIQSGARGPYGYVALAADGSLAAAFGAATLGVSTPATGALLWRAAHGGYGLQDFAVAVSADGSRIAAAGPDNELRSWPRDGGAATLFDLREGGQGPGRIRGMAVSTRGDAIAVADEKSAVWFAYPADRRVVRIALPAPAQSIAALPDNAGFAVGLADGMLVRLGRDGAVQGAPLKAAEIGAVGRIVVAADGASLIVVDGDEMSARHLDWTGKVLGGPIRAMLSERIRDAFFHASGPVIVAGRIDSRADDDLFNLRPFAGTGDRGRILLQRPRP